MVKSIVSRSDDSASRCYGSQSLKGLVPTRPAAKAAGLTNIGLSWKGLSSRGKSIGPLPRFGVALSWHRAGQTLLARDPIWLAERRFNALGFPKINEQGGIEGRDR